MGNLKIGAKMMVAFAAVAAIGVIIGIVGLNATHGLGQNADEIVSVRMPSIDSLLVISEAQTSVLAGERSLLSRRIFEDPAERAIQYARISDSFDRAEEAWKVYEPLPQTTEEAAEWKDFVGYWEKWKSGDEELVSMFKQKEQLLSSGAEDREAQIAALDVKILEKVKAERANFKKAESSLNKIVDINKKVAVQEMEAMDALQGSTRTLLIAAMICGFLLAIAIGFIFSRSLTRPITAMVDVADQLSLGNIDQEVAVDRGDELGQLAGSFQKMVESQRGLAAAAQSIADGDMNAVVTVRSDRDVLSKSVAAVRDTLKQLMAEMRHMANEHNAGDIDVQVDKTKFKGAYQEVAQGINDMVNGHIAVKKKAMACLAEFGRGNFEATLEKFPGKKAFINDTIEQMRANLKLLIADALMLVDAAVGGRLSTRADASKHAGDFRKIVQGVNETLDAVIDPVNEAARVLEQLAKNDLTARVMGNYQGDHANIKNALNGMADALDDALSQVSIAVDQVASAGNQISSSSQQVAEGASEQASSLEETSSSLEEMSSMTKQNADNAQQANRLGEGAKVNADNGAVAMGNMIDAMAKIRASAENTSAIISDINEIAFQTNLLALNAAVEAARAGDAGRGFAVVAEEVRNLALRSKEAAKRTEELIKQSVTLTESGEQISNDVNGRLAEIVESIGKVTDIVGEIAVASQEQSRGIDQVTQAVAQMDKVTQQNAANAEESSSASEELSSQAQELAAMVGQFKLSKVTQSFASRSTNAPKRISQPPAAKAKTPVRSSAKSNGNGHARAGIQLSPEDIIPMDNDPDFKNF